MSRLSVLAGLAVSASLLITPVAAQAGWGDGRGRHHRDRGIDAGDVIAGVLVLGAIAAIAGAADDNNDRRRQERRPEPDYRPRGEATRPANSNYQSSRGIDSAVGMCVDQVERGETRVDSVDNASRTADGWRVSGALETGAPWSCWIDNDGRIREIDLAAAESSAAAGGQLSDETYACARAAQASATMPDATQQPAYPGGPLPGEEGYEEAIQARTAI